MQHIQHLEDLLLTEGPAFVSNVINDIIADDYEVSIKYDGAPAIIFGTDDQGTFVATKSYFNKTPKKFYSREQILAGTPGLELGVKLCEAFRAICECHIPKGNIYWGDLLFWANQYETFKPNVVRYYRGGGDCDVGIAVHTQLAGDCLHQQVLRHTIWCPTTQMYIEDIDVPDWGGMPHEERHASIEDVLQRMKAAGGDDFWTRYVNYRLKEVGSTDLDYHMAWVYHHDRHVAGRITREELRTIDDAHFMIGGEAWYKVRETFDAIESWKTKLYKELNVHAQMVQLATINKEFWHEGFVIKTPTAAVKIVDREIFSVANFALWAKPK